MQNEVHHTEGKALKNAEANVAAMSKDEHKEEHLSDNERAVRMIVAPMILQDTTYLHEQGQDYYKIQVRGTVIEYRRKLRGWEAMFEVRVNGEMFLSTPIGSEYSSIKPGMITSFWHELEKWAIRKKDDARNIKVTGAVRTLASWNRELEERGEFKSLPF